MTKARFSLIASIVALGACSGEPDQPPADNRTAVVETVRESPAVPAAAPEPRKSDEPVLTATGYGPLRIGMTRAQVTAALGPDANPELVGGAEPEQCNQYRPESAPEGMLLMVEKDRLTRISLIRNAKVKTNRGLGLNATPAQVRAAYGARLQTQPHKYEPAPAQYLITWDKGGGGVNGPIAGSSRGIVYEVDGGGKVGSIRAGGPSILYVEGCS